MDPPGVHRADAERRAVPQARSGNRTPVRTELGLFDEVLMEVPEAERTRLAAEIAEALNSSRVKLNPRSLAQTMHNAWSGSSGRTASLEASIALGLVYAIMAIPSMWLLWFSFIMG